MNPAEHPLFRCFEHQFVLLMRFHEIEKQNVDVYETDSGAYSFALSDFESHAGQKYLRELGWRIVEEVAEHLDARCREPDSEKQYEEIADAFHFLIEFFIICGLTNQDFGSGKRDAMYEIRDEIIEQIGPESPEEVWAIFIRELGMTLNVLNTRPHHLKVKPFDYPLFRSRLIRLLEVFLTAAFYAGVPVDRLIDDYFRKARINQQRIESGV